MKIAHANLANNLIFLFLEQVFKICWACNCTFHYNSKCALYSSEKLDWEQAETACKNQGGFLTSVDSLEENDQIQGHDCDKTFSYIWRSALYFTWSTGGVIF